MTIIHVTIPDHTEALGVVATLLNQGYEISIDLDIVPAKPTMPPWLAHEVSRREWVESMQGGSEFNIDGTRVSPDEWAAEMAKRDMARYERAMESEQAIVAVACPLCKQERGDRCIAASGGMYSWHKVHQARWRMYTRGNDVTPA